MEKVPRNKIPTGSKILDRMLNDGYEKDIITTIYGPAGSGKTTLCMLCAISMSRSGKKVIYVDTEGGFSVERLKQICDNIHNDYKKVIDNIVFLKPTNFESQIKSFEKLKDLVNDKIGLIVVDTIAMLYRLQLGKGSNIKETNNELGHQVSYLTDIARNKNIPVLITNQVYSDFEKKDKVNIVGGDILKYGSKCLIELQVTEQGNRRLILQKARSIPEKREIYFKIVEGGILGTYEKKKKKFGLFSLNYS